MSKTIMKITPYETFQLEFAKRIEIDHEFDESVSSDIVWKEAKKRVAFELEQGALSHD